MPEVTNYSNMYLGISVTVVVIADIVLACCLRFILPPHLTQKGYYPADNRQLRYREAIKTCPCLTRIFPYGSRRPITFAKIEERVAKVKRSISEDTFPQQITQQLSMYPFVVSLSMPAYIDDPSQKIFVCNGIIKSANRLVTTKTCVEDESEWYNLTVRSASAYWSKMGKEHSIVNISHISDDLVELKVAPTFAKQLVPRPPFKYPFYGDWVHAVALGWDDEMYKKKVEFRYKNKPFDYEKWTSRDCQSRSSNVCFKTDQCKKLSSKALVTRCHQLVGMKFAGGEECNRFSSLGLDVKNVSIASNLQNTSCYEVYKDTCHLPEMDIC